MHDREDHDEDVDREGDAEQVAAAEEVEPAGKGGQREAAGDQVRRAAQRGEQGQRGDEGRHVEPLPELAGREAEAESAPIATAHADHDGDRRRRGRRPVRARPRRRCSPDSAAPAPTDRSISPEMITIVMPKAMMPCIVTLRSTFRRLPRVAKPGAVTTRSEISAAGSVPSDRCARKRASCPPFCPFGSGRASCPILPCRAVELGEGGRRSGPPRRRSGPGASRGCGRQTSSTSSSSVETKMAARPSLALLPDDLEDLLLGLHVDATARLVEEHHPAARC